MNTDFGLNSYSVAFPQTGLSLNSGCSHLSQVILSQQMFTEHGQVQGAGLVWGLRTVTPRSPMFLMGRIIAQLIQWV